MKVLIAEDDDNTRNGLREILDEEGYQVLMAANGRQALELYEHEQPDFLCLDIMMPEINGYDVCREIRKKKSDVPIIFISAKSEEIDKVLGLELGADDFITKPFGVKEVVARIRAVTRRYLNSAAVNNHEPFNFGPYTVYPRELRAKSEEQTVELSWRDIQILKLLYTNRGHIVNREQFFKECWNLDGVPNSRTLDQHISQLRKKIEPDPKDPTLILTVHGIGYRHQ